MRRLVVESLSIRAFRNLAGVDIELGPRFNVLSGDNGQGKTNLLECVYLLATSRSFRTSKLSELVAVGAEVASIRGVIREGDGQREQSVGLKPGMRAVRVDGKRPTTLAEYAVHTPTVVFHPGALALAAGGGAERRKLLDRVALYLSPASLVEADNYARAVRGRQRTLEARGESALDLDGWEELIVKHGSALGEARARAAEALAPAAENAFGRFGSSSRGSSASVLSLRARYARGAPANRETFRAELARHRTRDRARRSATVGPHRDDLALDLSGMPVRAMASQGQQRAVVLALEMAEIDVIAGARKVRPILLLDDVSSELDRARTSALLAALRDQEGQVLLTTTRPELIELEQEGASFGGDRVDFGVDAGRITRR